MCERCRSISGGKFIKTLTLSHSTMSLSVALTTERNQVLRFIVVKFALRYKVMNLQVFSRTTVLTAPTISF